MAETNIPSELRVARYAEARLKEIEALTQVLGKHEMNLNTIHYFAYMGIFIVQRFYLAT